MADAVWARRTADGWTIAVHAQPGAKRSEVAGLHGDRLKIRIAAPALDGRANDALIALVAEALGIAKSRITVAKGAQSREKRLVIAGNCDPTALLG